MEIPFHRAHITEEDIAGVVDALKSGWLTMGPKTAAFEEKFGQYIGAGQSVAVNSCTAALHLALCAIDLKPSDEVIVPAMTFAATAETVCYFGAKPVIVDVDRRTHNIDVACIERAITPKTRAIIPVHFGGQPCDMEEIIALARKRGLYVIEDAAHALPASYKGRTIGTIGDMTCFSFYATKTLATGEGGMMTTENPDWAARARRLRLHGISADAWKRYAKEGSWYYEVAEPGYKYNMTDPQAALGLSQLAKVDWMKNRRKDIALRYNVAFGKSDEIALPVTVAGRETAWHLYVIKLAVEKLKIDRAAFIEELKKKGIGTGVHFIPLYRHPFYRDTFGYRAEDFPVSEWLYERIVSLPIWPGMSESELEAVIEAVTDTAKKHRR